MSTGSVVLNVSPLPSMEKPATPTLDRRSERHVCDGSILTHSQIVGEFLDWLTDERHVVLAEWGNPSTLYPAHAGPSNLLHEFFGIDEKAEEAERRALLNWVRDPEGVFAERTSDA